MNNNFSRQVKEIISFGHQEAQRLGSNKISTGHLLLGMIKEDHSKAFLILKKNPAGLPEVKKEIEKGIEPGEPVPDGPGAIRKRLKFVLGSNRGLKLEKDAVMAIHQSVLQAKDAESKMIEAEHLILSILKNTEDPNAKILGRLGMDYNTVSLQLHQV